MKIEISKKLLDSYRDYKLDLLEDSVSESFIYSQLQDIISRKYSLSDLYELLIGREYIIIDIKTLHVSNINWTEAISMNNSTYSKNK